MYNSLGDIQMANKHMKRSSMSLFIKEIQIPNEIPLHANKYGYNQKENKQ